jgi:hypothetical protein
MSADAVPAVIEDAEHIVPVLESGPAPAPVVTDIRPVIEHTTSAVVVDLLAETVQPGFAAAVVSIDADGQRRERSRASVVALERLLKKVEARRLQLRSESVA